MCDTVSGDFLRFESKCYFDLAYSFTLMWQTRLSISIEKSNVSLIACDIKALPLSCKDSILNPKSLWR